MTSERTAQETVTATAGLVGALGSAFMFAPATLEAARQHGYADGFAAYFAGRGGVLGNVDADVVTAAFGFFEPSLVRKMWERGIEPHGARQAARHFADACRAWGRAHLGGLEGLDRFAELAERVVAAVEPAGLSLFAGWRAEPLPDDAEGRAAQLLHVLREWRGSVHLVAALAVGLTACEAIVAKDGEDRARMFGWAEPFADPVPLRGRRDEAERMTDALCAAVYERALTPAERAELVAAVERMGAVVLG